MRFGLSVICQTDYLVVEYNGVKQRRLDARIHIADPTNLVCDCVTMGNLLYFGKDLYGCAVVWTAYIG